MAAAAAAALCASAAAAEYANPHGVAVIVGNRNYEHRDVPEVSYAHRDAAAFRRYVLDVLGFDPENIIDLRDASQAALETAFGNERHLEGDLWSYLDPEGGSDVVVFYSGHGVPGLDDGRGYLLPANADPNTAEINGYPIDVLYANLGKLGEARSVRVFLDACFSGGSDRGMLVRSASPVFVDADLPSAPRALTVLTAASGDQVASWDEAAGHGLFTHHLLDALYGAGDADGDGSVTALEAKAYLDRHMTRAARRALRRRQNASLHGDAAAVLAAAAGGAFPDRPVVAGAADGAEGQEGAGALAALPAAPDPVAAEAALGLDRAARALVQRGLASLAFDPGPVDGSIGPRTRSALGAWQSAKGYEATGRLTREQAEALVAMGREAESADRAERERLAREAEARAEHERLAREAEARAERDRLARERAAAEREHHERAAAERARRAREREPGRVFRDCAECPEMVVLPSGSFDMGSPSSEAGRWDVEGPVHRVRIRHRLAVGRYEVTRREFARFVWATNRGMGNSCWVWDHDAGDWKELSGSSWRSPGFSQGGDHPVVCVSWEDAVAYTRWLSRETGHEYRLLSESEWEYAARAGTRTARYWGAGAPGQCRYANGAAAETSFDWRDEGCSDGYTRTAPVGSFGANGWKLHDMLGNVWEWTQDCWNDDYNGAPSDGSAWKAGDCSARVLRGSSWGSVPRNLRAATRNWVDSKDRDYASGFRVARTLAP